MRVAILLAVGTLLAGAMGCAHRSTPPPSTGPAPTIPGLTIRGTITNEGVECLAMRDENGRLYTLSGPIGSFKPGDKVCVKGRVIQISTCMQGTTIGVDWIGPASDCP